jgi:hypothetical protein
LASRSKYLLPETHKRHWQRHTQTESKRKENNTPGSRSQNQADVAILLSNKINFKPKLARRDKEGHYILIREKSIEKINAPSFIRQALLHIKGQIGPDIITQDDFNIPLTSRDHPDEKSATITTKDLKPGTSGSRL